MPLLWAHQQGSLRHYLTRIDRSLYLTAQHHMEQHSMSSTFASYRASLRAASTVQRRCGGCACSMRTNSCFTWCGLAVVAADLSLYGRTWEGQGAAGARGRQGETALRDLASPQPLPLALAP